MREAQLEEWFNRAIQITFVCGMYSFNGDTISPAQLTIRFHQDDIDEYLKFSSYINQNYEDYEKIVDITQTAEEQVDLNFTFNGYDIIKFGVTGVKCSNFRIKDWFSRQPKDKSINLLADINKDANTLLELSEKDPSLNSQQATLIHRWVGKSL